MSKIKQIAEGIKEKILLLEATRVEHTIAIVQDAFALLADRIQNTGVSAEGTPMPRYSKEEHHWAVALLNPQNFNAPGKIQKFKDAVKEGKTDASYEALRRAYGLPTNKRTLTFDGSMFNKIGPVVVEQTDSSTTIVLRGTDEKTNDKIKGNSYHAKTNILALSQEEKELVTKLNIKRIKRALNI